MSVNIHIRKASSSIGLGMHGIGTKELYLKKGLRELMAIKINIDAAIIFTAFKLKLSIICDGICEKVPFPHI